MRDFEFGPRPERSLAQRANPYHDTPINRPTDTFVRGPGETTTPPPTDARQAALAGALGGIGRAVPRNPDMTRFMYGVNPTSVQNLTAPSVQPTNIGDPKTYFLSLVQGKPATPAVLESLEPQLNAVGIKLARNAAGIAGDIELPDGRIIDVIPNASSGGGPNWQWMEPTTSTGRVSGGGTSGLLGMYSSGKIPMMTQPGLTSLFSQGAGAGQDANPLLDYITKQLAVFNAIGNRG